ncbi:hypothetical protein B0A50_01480 [Salinomyces thailandicus]|uniref:BTB domain-containing protein n=1 Tax=Salinomyces thailandicus TaxID=706561 RepID=A0A4U0UAX9_9PEZI|nr:hypothetical protein B0A50_01480 [Salinomyces thailandica]
MALPLGVIAYSAAGKIDNETSFGGFPQTKTSKRGDSPAKTVPRKCIATSTQQSPRNYWRPAKKQYQSPSAKALERNKRACAETEASRAPRLDGTERPLAGPAKAKPSSSAVDDIFELAETSPRGGSTTRPKHIPIVIPDYDPLARDHTEVRSGSLSTTLSSGSEHSSAVSILPSASSYKLVGYGPTPKTSFDRAKPRHVEIRIPSWAQPVVKQPATPPRLQLSYSTFIDPFADVNDLSPPDLSPSDMSRPTPDSSRANTMDSSTSPPPPDQLYADRSAGGSHTDLISASSSQSSLVGLQAEYESASEAESSHENAPTSQAKGSSQLSQAPDGTTPNASSTANLSGLVCNVHRTTGREPHPLVGATTTVLGDKLYVFGGRRLSRTKPQLTSNLYELDLVKRHWTKVDVKGDIPPPRYFHSVCPLGDTKLVCYGGMSPATTPPSADPDAQPEVIVMSDIHVFDVLSRTWTKIHTAESPQGRYAHCAAVLPSSAVFASSSAPMSALHHNPSSSNPNAGQLGVALDGAGGAEMVVVGGQDSANHYIEQVSIFNLRSLKWTGTTTMGRSCGAYRSVVTPLATMKASQIGAGLHAPGSVKDEEEEESATVGSGAPMLIYSNYNFLDVKLELQVRLTDGSLTEKPMQSGVSPPGLRFPNGGVIDNHFVVSGTFLTSSKQEYALWALDLRTLTWSRIDAGGSIFSQGSWNRGVLWNRRNSFVILGNRKRNMVDDYNNRRINFSNICVVELEAFGLYENPRAAEPTSSFVSTSANVPYAHHDAIAAGRQLALAAEGLGALSLGVRELADMDFLAIDGTRIPVNSRLIARRWGPHFINLLKESLLGASDADAATLRPSVGSHQSRNSSVTITPSVNSGATTLTNNTHSDLPDARSYPPSARPRLFYLPHTTLTLQALLHYLYTSILPGPPSPLATPQVFCSLLQLARPYKIDGLLEAVVERLHESLDGRNAAAIFNAAAMAAGGGDAVLFASAHASTTTNRNSTFPVRTASLAGMEGLLNGVARSASSLRIDTDMANGRPGTLSTLGPGRTGLAEASGGEEEDGGSEAEVEMPGSAATDVSLSESETSLAGGPSSSRLLGARKGEGGTGTAAPWVGSLSAVVGLQKRGLRGLMEGRRMRERGKSDGVEGVRMGLGIA